MVQILRVVVPLSQVPRDQPIRVGFSAFEVVQKDHAEVTSERYIEAINGQTDLCIETIPPIYEKLGLVRPQKSIRDALWENVRKLFKHSNDPIDYDGEIVEFTWEINETQVKYLKMKKMRRATFDFCVCSAQLPFLLPGTSEVTLYAMSVPLVTIIIEATLNKRASGIHKLNLPLPRVAQTIYETKVKSDMKEFHTKWIKGETVSLAPYFGFRSPAADDALILGIFGYPAPDTCYNPMRRLLSPQSNPAEKLAGLLVLREWQRRDHPEADSFIVDVASSGRFSIAPVEKIGQDSLDKDLLHQEEIYVFPKLEEITSTMALQITRDSDQYKDWQWEGTIQEPVTMLVTLYHDVHSTSIDALLLSVIEKCGSPLQVTSEVGWIQFHSMKAFAPTPKTLPTVSPATHLGAPLVAPAPPPRPITPPTLGAPGSDSDSDLETLLVVKKGSKDPPPNNPESFLYGKLALGRYSPTLVKQKDRVGMYFCKNLDVKAFDILRAIEGSILDTKRTYQMRLDGFFDSYKRVLEAWREEFQWIASATTPSELMDETRWMRIFSLEIWLNTTTGARPVDHFDFAAFGNVLFEGKVEAEGLMRKVYFAHEIKASELDERLIFNSDRLPPASISAIPSVSSLRHDVFLAGYNATPALSIPDMRVVLGIKGLLKKPNPFPIFQTYPSWVKDGNAHYEFGRFLVLFIEGASFFTIKMSPPTEERAKILRDQKNLVLAYEKSRDAVLFRHGVFPNDQLSRLFLLNAAIHSGSLEMIRRIGAHFFTQFCQTYKKSIDANVAEKSIAVLLYTYASVYQLPACCVIYHNRNSVPSADDDTIFLDDTCHVFALMPKCSWIFVDFGFTHAATLAPRRYRRSAGSRRPLLIRTAINDFRPVTIDLSDILFCPEAQWELKARPEPPTLRIFNGDNIQWNSLNPTKFIGKTEWTSLVSCTSPQIRVTRATPWTLHVTGKLHRSHWTEVATDDIKIAGKSLRDRIIIAENQTKAYLFVRLLWTMIVGEDKYRFIRAAKLRLVVRADGSSIAPRDVWENHTFMDASRDSQAEPLDLCWINAKTNTVITGSLTLEKGDLLVYQIMGLPMEVVNKIG